MDRYNEMLDVVNKRYRYMKFELNEKDNGCKFKNAAVRAFVECT